MFRTPKDLVSRSQDLCCLLLLFPVTMLLLTGISSCDDDQDNDGYSDASGDCDDNDASVYPGALETCDGRDNDCNGSTDEGLAFVTFYQDLDADGYGSSRALESCGWPAGYVMPGGDCDDAWRLTYPGAAEAVDGADNDCDGQAEALLPPRYFRDLDGDGFGLETVVSTEPMPGYVTAFGDCDDSRSSVHPGAPDAAGDGLDSDCGGNDDPQPSVGLEASGYDALQPAIDAASDGQTVWVGPGHWLEHDLTLGGKAITLAGPFGAEATVLDALSQGRVLVLDAGEGSSTRLKGLSFVHGKADQAGGAVLVVEASPTFEDCIFRSSSAVSGGGGVAIQDGASSFLRCNISGNLCENTSYGAGMTISGGPVLIRESVLSGNLARNAAGGIFLSGSLTVEHSRITANWCDVTGAGIVAMGGNLTLSSSEVADNRSGGGGALAAMYGAQVTVDGCTFSRNFGSLGGAAYIDSSTATFARTLFLDNYSRGTGGATYWNYCTGSISHCTLVRNRGTEGGGVYLSASAAVPIRSSILAFNRGRDLYAAAGTADLTYSLLYSSPGSSHNLASLPPTNFSADPLLVRDAPLQGVSFLDAHLSPTSPARNAGPADELDPDGSRADLGAYGGPGADLSFYADADRDGLADGWEALEGLDPTVAEASDPDGDGVSNASEQSARTRPQRADSDGDGANDGAELTAGSDALDWYFRPGSSLAATARVPQDFGSLQEALDLMPREGSIEVAPGRYPGASASGVNLTLRAPAGPSATTLMGSNGSVFSLEDGQLILEGFTLTGGQGQFGSGLALTRVKGSLSQLVLTRNRGSTVSGGMSLGGGLYAKDCQLTMNDLEVSDNVASRGGGLELDSTYGTYTNLSIHDNSSSSHGGGLSLVNGSPTLNGLHMARNVAGDNGGGIYLSNSSPVISGCQILDSSGYYGGGIYGNSSNARLDHCILRGNAAASGGGLYLSQGAPWLQYVLVEGNTGRYDGGGMRLINAVLKLEASVVIRNESDGPGSGIYLQNPATTGAAVITHAIVAYNGDENLVNESTATWPTVVKWCDLFNPSGANHNLSSLDSSNLTVEPGFLSYDEEGLPSDPHLSLVSSLIGKGDPTTADVDGSSRDLGLFGGAEGAGFDLDGDGRPWYFWPGRLEDAPPGFDAEGYEAVE